MILYKEKPVIQADKIVPSSSSCTVTGVRYGFTVERVHVSVGGDDSIYACVSREHPGNIDWGLLVESCHSSVCDKLIAYSPTLASSLRGYEPGNWLKRGYKSLDDLCVKLAPILEKWGVTLLFQPHARHVLSDYRICLEFLKAHNGEPFGIALAAGDLIEPGMVKD